MKRKTRRGGFTLAELLIVVAIIGVLTSLAIVVYADQLEKARHTNDMSTMRAAKQALVMASMDGLIQADGKTRYYYNPSAGEVSTNIPEEGYGKSWTNSKDWWTGEGSSIGTPNVDGKHPARLSMTVSSEGKVNYYWCGAYGGLAVSSAEEFMSLSQEERLERDLLLLNSLQDVMRSMTYGELYEMLMDPNGGKYKSGLRLERGSDGNICVVLSYSNVDKNGNTTKYANGTNIFLESVFQSAGYDTSVGAENTYLINSVTGATQTIWCDLKITANQLKNMNSSDPRWNQCAADVFTYVKSGGLKTPEELRYANRNDN